LKRPLLPRITADEKITLPRVTAIEKTMPAEAESLREEFGATCVCTGARLPKEAPREADARRNADALREVVRGHVSGGTGARHLEKHARETRMPAVTRMPAGRRKS